MNLVKVKEQIKRVGLDGWANDWDIENIYNTIASLKEGGVYLEIGVARGVSLSIANLAAKPSIKLVGIDIINWSDREENIKNIINEFGVTSQHIFIEGDSQVEAKTWRHGKINALYIDGDHEYLGVLKDMVSWFPHLASGATVMFDDFNDKTGVKKAVEEILTWHSAFKNGRVDNEMYICEKI